MRGRLHSLLRRSVLLVLLGPVLACGPDAEAPAGFATYRAPGPLRAVSPEGIVYRVRTEANEPRADLAFWREALRQRMLDAGYRLVGEEDIRAGTAESGLDGGVLELAAPVGERDVSYLIALFVDGDELILAEAAGEVLAFRERREAVLAAVRSIEP